MCLRTTKLNHIVVFKVMTLLVSLLTNLITKINPKCGRGCLHHSEGWKRSVPPKRWCPRTKSHDSVSQKITTWNLNVKFQIKIKCTLVQTLRLCTGRTAHRGSRGIALTFHDHGPRRGWGVSVTPRPLLTPGKDPVPIVQGTGWAPEPVWTGAENLASNGIRSPDRPARSQSLYRLGYQAHKFHIGLQEIN